MSTYKEGLVCFLDILGTQNTTDFEQSYERHKIWHSEARDLQEREKQGSNKTLLRKIYSFTDCAYCIFQFKNEIEQERRLLERYVEAITNLLIPLQKMLEKGIFVRGGLCIGDIFFDESGLFGKAANLAYQLEIKKARFPRIIIEKTLGKKLYTMHQNMPFQSLFLKDTENEEEVFYVNVFYGISTPGWGGHLEDQDNFYKNVQNHIVSNKNNNINNEEIVCKMNWLANALEKENKIIYNDLSVVRKLINR